MLRDTEVECADMGWTMLQQHFDDNSQIGHRSTALELMEQCSPVGSKSVTLLTVIVAPKFPPKDAREN